MCPKANKLDKRLRQRIAMEAARLMDEHAIRDFHIAKRKAAAQLGVSNTQALPRNSEIELALAEYQRLFKSHSQPRHLRTLREQALEAMQFFSQFDPRLVGAVLRGSAGAHSDVSLHVFAESPELVRQFLQERGIPFEECERRLHLNADNYAFFPAYRFVAGDTTMELTVFSRNGLRQAPLSQVDGKPMHRANLAEVRQLLEQDDAEFRAI